MKPQKDSIEVRTPRSLSAGWEEARRVWDVFFRDLARFRRRSDSVCQDWERGVWRDEVEEDDGEGLRCEVVVGCEWLLFGVGARGEGI